MKKLLLIRFSALGDVVMTVPVVCALAQQYPDIQITVLSKESMHPYFKDVPSNVLFRGVRLKADYHGVGGLMKLYRHLKIERYDYVGDLHDVIRSKYLRWRFSIKRNVRVEHINKGRSDKKRIISTGIIHQTLPSSFERYADVLKRLGFPVRLDFKSIWHNRPIPSETTIPNFDLQKQDERWIGIAPFAAHQGKIYPLDKMEKVVELLCHEERTRVFLFGGGRKEKEVLEQWASLYPNVYNAAGKFSKHEELVLMAHLDVMVSMDSANMHIASLVGTPVVSVWGATHPCLGFMGWGQKVDNAVQVDLACRPCSVYGNRECRRGDYACLNGIAPQTIVEKVIHLIE